MPLIERKQKCSSSLERKLRKGVRLYYTRIVISVMKTGRQLLLNKSLGTSVLNVRRYKSTQAMHLSSMIVHKSSKFYQNKLFILKLMAMRQT